jgi:hypothetical protein
MIYPGTQAISKKAGIHPANLWNPAANALDSRSAASAENSLRANDLSPRRSLFSNDNSSESV